MTGERRRQLAFLQLQNRQEKERIESENAKITKYELGRGARHNPMAEGSTGGVSRSRTKVLLTVPLPP